MQALKRALLAALVLAVQGLRRRVRSQQAAADHQRALIDVLPIGLVVWDAGDRLVMCNADFRRMYPALAPVLQPGLPFESLLRHALAAGLVPEAAGREQAWVAARLAQHRQPGEPIVRRMSDGRCRRIVEQRLPDGWMVSHSVDITEMETQRVALDEALAAGELAWRTLAEAVEALPAGFELYDAEDRLVMTNAVMRQMYPAVGDLWGARPTFEQLVRENHARGGLGPLPQPFEDWFAARLQQRRSGGEPRLHPSGAGRWIRTYERPLDSGGSVGVRIDVTEVETSRAQAQQAHQAAELAANRLRDAIDSLPDGFALYDADDRLVLCNARYKELYAAASPFILEGMSFEDVLRQGLARGLFAAAVGREEAWLAERIAAHRHPRGPLLQELPGNRWLRIDERPTREGGIAGVRTDVTELVRREQELHAANRLLNSTNTELSRLSETDALTGLANRRLFDRRLAEELAQARLQRRPLSLAIVDVDHFKRYNDCHGHPAGDACLKQVALLLRDTARRPSDLVARLGGEEFALLLPHDDAAAALALGERCLAALDRACLPHGDSPVAAHVTISIGVADLAALTSPPCAADVDLEASLLLRAADQALYAAKASGRRRVVVAGSRGREHA